MASQSTGERVATVLVVDQNPETAFGVLATLGKQEGLRLIEAGNADEAMDVLVTQVVDAIVTCVSGAEDGLALLKQVRQQNQLTTLPFLFLAEDDCTTSKVEAFEHGASDYLTPPFAMAEIVARVRAAIRRQLVRGSSAHREGCLGGDLQTIVFSDLVHLLQIARRTGTLTLLFKGSTGQALFVDGQVYHATFGSMEGEEAFYRLVYEQRGYFEFKPRDFDLGTVRNTVALATTTLLMEAARRQDSWRRDHPDGEMPDESESPPERTATPKTLRPAERGSEAAAAELIQQVSGSPQARLQLITRDQLPTFTAAEGGAARCLVLLVADRKPAITAACSGALPPDPDFVERALEFEQNVLALRWSTPAGANLDVLLLDQEFPGYVLNELLMQPTALIVAPRGGDWFALSMLAQDEIGTMLGHLRPRHLLGLGEPTLDEGLGLLAQRGGVDVPTSCLPTPLEQWSNLRGALQEVLQLWCSMVPVAAQAAPVPADG